MKDVAEYYMEVSGCALSDEVKIFAAVKDPACTAEAIAEALYKRVRIHVPVELVDMETARQKVFGKSRKPVRFFDLRETFC